MNPAKVIRVAQILVFLRLLKQGPVGELIAVTLGQAGGLQAAGRVNRDQSADSPGKVRRLRGHRGHSCQVGYSQRPGRRGKQPQDLRREPVVVAAEQVINLLKGQVRQLVPALERTYRHRFRLSQGMPPRKVTAQIERRSAAHQDMGAATSPRWQQLGDAGQPGRAKVLIQPVHDQQQGTVFGFGSLGRALPECPVLMRVRDRGVFLQQVGQLRDHCGEEP